MTTPPILDSIPAELKSLKRWVLWKHEERGGKITKVPLRADSGLLAEADNQTTWASFNAVKEAFEKGRGGAEGIGFVFARATAISGVDLDHCRDPATGQIDTWAEDILRRLNSYTEVSPSGTGLHVFAKGTIPVTGADGGKRKTLKGDGYRPDAAIEMYSNKRFFTMTGQVLPGYPLTVEDRQNELTALYSEIWGEGKTSAQDSTKQAQDGPREAQDDQKKAGSHISKRDKKIIHGILIRMKNSPNSADIEKLLMGDISAYGGDDSAADLALCNHLAFYCNKNPRLMDIIFRRTKLMREKWDEPRGNTTYGEMTIAKAIAGTLSGDSSVDGGTPNPTPPDPEIVAKATKIIEDGQLPEFWIKVFLRRHNGDTHIALAMLAANLTPNITNSHGIAVLQVAGDSGDGKSHAVQTVAQQMGKWCDISGLSPMALLYHAGQTIFEKMMVVMDDNRPDDRQGDIIKRAQTQFKTGYKYKTVLKGDPVELQMPPGIQLLTTEVDADAEDQVLNRTLLLEVKGSPEKDKAIIDADLARLENGDQPLSDPDILICQTALDLLKAKTFSVSIPDARKRLKWTERRNDGRANLRNYNIFLDILLAYAVMRWPARPHHEKDGVIHVEAIRQDFADALRFYHTIFKQMKTKLTSKEIELLELIRKHSGRILREDAQKELSISRQRLDVLLRGRNGTSGILAKFPGLYIEDTTESGRAPASAGCYDPKVRKRYLCLNEVFTDGQSIITSSTDPAQWIEE